LITTFPFNGMLDRQQITPAELQLAAIICVTVPRDEIRYVTGPEIGEPSTAIGIAPAMR
jgi:hypothetical protein